MAKWTKKMPNANYQVELEMNQVSQSISGNYSNVAWSFRIRKLSGSGYWNNDTSTWSASIGGNGYTGSGTYDFRGTSVKTLLSGTTRINHASNGTGSVTGSTWFSDNGGVLGNAGNTGHVLSLTTIPRASKVTSLSGSSTIGSSMTVNISRASSAFTHRVYYHLPGQAWVLFNTEATTSASFTIPVSESSFLPNSSSGRMDIMVKTMQGSTQIGANIFTGKTVYVPSSVVPSFSSLSVSEGNASVTSAIGNAYVQSRSKAKLTINGAKGIYGSSIKSYRITGHGINTSGSSGTTSTITSSGNITYTATITDSRGRTAKRTATINVLPYAPPRLSGLSYYRSNSSGTADPLGTYVTIKGKVTSSSLVVGGVQKNIVNYQSQTALGSAWVARTSQSYGKTSHSYSATFGGFGVDNSYNVRSRAGDIFTWGSWSAGIIPTGEVLQQWARKTTSFGKMIDDQKYNVQVGLGGLHSEGPIVIGSSTIADFVVEQGTNYTKWNSGKLECWGRGSQYTATFPSSPNWGSVFTSGSGGIPEIKFPVAFVDIPSLSYSFERISGGNFFIMQSLMNTSKTSTCSWELVRGTTGTSITGYMRYHAIGRWK